MAGPAAGFVRARGRAAVALLALGALLVTGACTSGGSGDGDGDEGRPFQPAKLKKVWSAPVKRDFDQESDVWTGGGVLALRDRNALTGYDASTGEQRWKLGLPKGTNGICAVSDEPNTAGLGAVLFASKSGHCTHAGAVDVTNGKVRWVERVSSPAGTSRPEDSGISMGDDALTVVLKCSHVAQLRPSDGESLGTRLKGDRACAHDVDVDGRLLAVREAPAGDAEEKVPGWMPASDGDPARFALYEGAGRKPLWSTNVRRVRDKMNGIVSDDPVTLDTTRQGQRLIQTYDSHGKPLRTIGKRLKDFPSDSTAGSGPYTHGNTLVMGYQRDPALYAYDLRTGKVRWKKRQDRAELLGVWKDKLLAVRYVKGRTEGRPAVPWLVTYGMRDGEERTVGRIADRGVVTRTVAAWDDERLYLPSVLKGERRLVAYRLPRSGGDTERYTARTEPVREEKDVVTRGWRKGDLRPDKVANACEAVSPAAQKRMRVHREGMPPPVDCAWEERYAPRHADRDLSVSVTAHQPGGDKAEGGGIPSASGAAPTPAVKVAARAFKFGDNDSDDGAVAGDKPMTDAARRVEGLGDEAKAVTYGSVRDSSSSVHLLVRHRNVTVHVRAHTEALSDEKRGEVPPAHRVEAGVRLAAVDVLERLGADVPASAKRGAEPVGGRTTEVEPVCSRLREEAARLAPGAEALDTTAKGGADGRAAGCYWEPEDYTAPTLTVRVKATPDAALTGDSATKVAKAGLKAAEGAKFPGVGDEARMDQDDAEMRTLTVRKGNVVMYVDYDGSSPLSKSQLDAEMKKVARRVLSVY